ncbi:exocyst complex component Sec10-like protein [Talaromyces proteolyticus]|uniref:Exocyst complex component Sec10-like protein n=1 Tax=Talaromyces proteolyticus TaxID=1131652 RepID=A0AAD4PTT1_9EURO|nr:exocyst complex component Sec10-like protein [Talaromyces proteolyticus]KAH8689194.1 exocyst complex component Sec10-like protein [Talaromyces proteolyticus]
MPESSSTSSHSHHPSRTLYPKGPSFDLEYFSGRDYIVKDFVESLSDGAIATRRSAGGAAGANQAFDPKPLIRTFEHAQGTLNDLLGDLEIRENELSAAVRRAEAQHAQNLNTLGRKLNHTIESFQKLDTSLNGAGLSKATDGNMAVETGKRLEELDRQRRRALDAHFLIECWDEVSNRGDITKLETLRRSGNSEGKLRVAHIAKQLLRISQRLDPKSWNDNSNGSYGNGELSPALNGNGGDNLPKKNTREIIEKFSETLEKDLLKQFDDFYRKANFEGMKECASVLRDFNGGASVVALFVNQHQFFIDRSQLVTEEVGGDAETWEKLADPDTDPPGVEPSLQSLVDDVKVVVQDESAIIRRAFPYYDEVLGRFLQRVFQQSIQQRLEMVLEKASEVSSLAFLRSLQSSRGYLNTLVDDLKAHGLTEAPDSIASQTAILLDQQLEDLFVPYFVGSSYIERERKNLEELYASLLFKFTAFHSRRKKTATTFMASLAKSGSELLTSAKESYIYRLDSSESTPTQRQMLLRVAGLKDPGDVSKPTEPELTEQDGVLSVSYAKRMLRWLAEGVGRGLELSVSSETPKDVSSLLSLLLTTMGESYVDVALDAALDAATAQENSKTEPDFTYLQTLRGAISVTHLMLTCINTVLIPLAANNVTTRREMEKKTNFAVSRAEDKVNAIEQRTIDVALVWVGKLLGGQKKNDFRPKEGDSSTAWLEMLQTPTCEAICTFLTQLHNTALTYIPSSGSNLQTLFTELALGVRTQLLEHFRRFQVNGPGGLMVTKDMTRYANLFKEWDLEPEAKSAIDTLLEVGSLFVVGSEALREKLRGGQASGSTGNTGAGAAGRQTGSSATADTSGAGLSVQEIRAYVLKRVDTNTVAMQSVLNSL